MKVNRFVIETVLIIAIAAGAAIGTGCTNKQGAPVATAPAPQVGAPVSDPQVKEFLATLEKTPPADRNQIIQSNEALVKKIMNGNDAQAKVQFKKILGH